MNSVRILDCTLRDGGYVNDFRFGNRAIQKIIEKLERAAVDIIECGFLKEGETDKDCTLFGRIEMIGDVVRKKSPGTMYVAMIQQGKIRIEDICDAKDAVIDGIRLTFHEHEIEESFAFAKLLMAKGYKVFMQPVGTTTYTEQALLELVERINQLQPYAFYMVDTLGTMFKNDMLKMFRLIDDHLSKNVILGFHSHNNLQMSFSNATEFLQIDTERERIIDSSVMGMGRGAGNLNTELITQFINSTIAQKYNIIEILEVLDEYIRPLSTKYFWGYDAAYFISSAAKCHPNYASYLLNKQTLHVQDIFKILNGLDVNKRTLYDEKSIETEYLEFMSHTVEDRDARNAIASEISGKRVVVLAPGKTLAAHGEEVKDFCQREDTYVISVNFLPDELPSDMLFISNMKRFQNLDALTGDTLGIKTVAVTSNIVSENQEGVLVLNYSDYLNDDIVIRDNAGMMCLNLLEKLHVSSVYLAGFDGFSVNSTENYYSDRLVVKVEADHLLQMNAAISRKLGQLNRTMKIEFLTESAYHVEEENA